MAASTILKVTSMLDRFCRVPVRALVTLLAMGAMALNAAGQTPPIPASAACPAVPQMPTQQQLMDGVKAAKDHGVLWRISKDGHTSYLFGTLHVGTLAWAFPGPSIQKALRETQVVAMELNVTDPAVQQTMAAPVPVEQRPVVSPALRERLDAQTRLACLPAQALAALHPVMEVMTYTLLAGRWDGLDPSYGQEMVLAGYANAGKRPIKALETAQSQRDVLIPTDAKEALKTIDQALDLLEKNKVRPALKRLAQAWADGDLAELSAYEQWCDCVMDDSDRATMRRLNDDRNPHLAEGIDALHAQGQTVFAAVGALHMTGAKGLPTLMAQRGYTVERVNHAP